MKSPRFLIAAVALVAAAGPIVALGPEKDGFARVGAGQHRADLDAMELKPFNAALWNDLTGWTNGSALDAASTDGQVVLIFTWRSWHAVTHKALTTAQQLADRYGKDGLIVVGVHDAKGFDGAAKVAEEKGAKVRFAHDAAGKFAAALRAEHAPSYYLIDRAGNLRVAYADRDGLDRAVAALVKETKEQAAAVPGNREALAAKAAEEARKARPVSETYRPNQVLDVAFNLPDASAYDGVAWPEVNQQVEHANNIQGKTLPASFGSETWISEKPNTNGRIVVIDFWATWCGPCKAVMPKLDELQKANRADLTIIGLSDEQVSKVRSFLAANKHQYAQAVDPKATIKKAINISAIPHVVVMSTDGVVRWQGNPHNPAFAKVVKKLIDVDPGVAARRKAEESYRAAMKG
jgi:thiol-disulfide isomerase/thioredoxin